MKTCYKCKEEKPLGDFHKNKRKSDGYQNYCKACAKIRNRAYYLSTPHRNPQRRASRDRARNTAREYVWQYLLDNPCVDCGYTNPIALEFDHVRGKKIAAIAVMVTRGLGLITIKEEIAKCEVRCANCHRIVTSNRAGWWKKTIE